MKKLIQCCVFVVLACAVWGQSVTPTVGTIAASVSSCSTFTASAACTVVQLPPSVTGASITLTSTWSATLQFEQSADGQNTWTSVNCAPQPSGSAASSATANGTWVCSLVGMTHLRVRASAYTSGVAAVVVQPSIASGIVASPNSIGQPVLIGANGLPVSSSAWIDAFIYCTAKGISLAAGTDVGPCVNAAATAFPSSVIDLRGLPTRNYLNSPMVTPAGYVITAAANASGGSTVYTGTFSNIANQLVGYSIAIAGFGNGANNGTFTISASTSTTITVNNAGGIAQSGQPGLGTITASQLFSGSLLFGYQTFFINSGTGLQSIGTGTNWFGEGRSANGSGGAPYLPGTGTGFELCSSTDTSSADFTIYCASTAYTAVLSADGNNYPAILSLNGYLPSAGAVGSSGITALAARLSGFTVGCGMLANVTGIANYDSQEGSKMDNFYPHDCSAAGDIAIDIGGGTGGAQNSWITDFQVSTLSGKTNATSATGIRVWGGTGNGIVSLIEKGSVVNNAGGSTPNYDFQYVGGSSTAGQVILMANHFESATICGICVGVVTVKGVDQGGAANGLIVIDDNCGPGFGGGAGSGCYDIFNGAIGTGTATVTNVSFFGALATNATPVNVITDANNTSVPIATHFVSRYETNGSGQVISDTSGTNLSKFAGGITTTSISVNGSNTFTGSTGTGTSIVSNNGPSIAGTTTINQAKLTNLLIDTTIGFLSAGMTAGNSSAGTNITNMTWTIVNSKNYRLSCDIPVLFVASATIAFGLADASGAPTAADIWEYGNIGASAAFQEVDLHGATTWATAKTGASGAPGAVTEVVHVGATFQANASAGGTLTLQYIANGTNNVQILGDAACELHQVN